MNAHSDFSIRDTGDLGHGWVVTAKGVGDTSLCPVNVTAGGRYMTPTTVEGDTNSP